MTITTQSLAEEAINLAVSGYGADAAAMLEAARALLVVALDKDAANGAIEEATKIIKNYEALPSLWELTKQLKCKVELILEYADYQSEYKTALSELLKAIAQVETSGN